MYSLFTVFSKPVLLGFFRPQSVNVGVGSVFYLSEQLLIRIVIISLIILRHSGGVISRKHHDTSKAISMRCRLRKVNRGVKEEDKLCKKTTTALSYLLGLQNYAYILAALKHLGKFLFLKFEGWLIHKMIANVMFFHG